MVTVTHTHEYSLTTDKAWLCYTSHIMFEFLIGRSNIFCFGTRALAFVLWDVNAIRRHWWRVLFTQGATRAALLGSCVKSLIHICMLIQFRLSGPLGGCFWAAHGLRAAISIGLADTMFVKSVNQLTFPLIIQKYHCTIYGNNISIFKNQ